MTLQRKNETNKTGTNILWIVIAAMVITTIINWFLVTSLAAPKSVYASDINKINNSIGHVNDSTTSLNVFSNYQNTRIDDLTDNTQTQFEEINGALNDTNNKLSQTQNNLVNEQANTNNLKAQSDNLQNQTNSLTTQTNQINTQLSNVNQKADNTKAALDTLTTKVNGLAPGLQIIPTVSSSTITLTINSDIPQIVAFRIEFRPVVDTSTSANTMDAALAALYANPPVSLTAGVVVRGDYTLFWNTTDSFYHLGQITFLTKGTSLSAGANIRSITYTASGSYEILVTPIYPTGTSTGSW